MSESASDRRMAENEVVFRQYNEQFKKFIDGANGHKTEDFDKPVGFYCECSDENCTKKVLLKPSRYTEIHKTRDHFVIVCGHETKTIEKIVGEEADFYIVEKFMSLPEEVPGLNATAIDNS